MNPTSLLLFVPLGIGVAWLFHLIFRAKLASEPIGKIVSYFVGVFIIVLTVGWLIDNFLPRWFNDRLQNTTRSTEWRQVIDTSTSIVENTFNPNSSTTAPIVAPQPTPASIIDQQPPVNNNGGQNNAGSPTTSMDGVTTYTVVTGDTLSGIATRFGTTVDALMTVNNLRSHIIYPGDTLIIPQGK